MRPHLLLAPGPSRPVWMLMVIALPLGMVLNFLTGGWANLSDSLLVLMGWQHGPTTLQVYAAGVVSHVAAPALVAFLFLRATRLGAWLAPNRLALGCLLVVDALVVGVALRGLFLASIHESPFMGGLLADVTEPVMVGALSVGLATLAASTVWYRLVKGNDRATDWCASLLGEV